MAEIVLFHHAHGLTDGVRAFAAELERAGQTVHLPDLYEGQVFATLDEGLAYAQRAGFTAIRERGVAAAEKLPTEVVYAGFSLGVMPAQQLTQTRPGAKAAFFLHSCADLSYFGGSWPEGVPVQIHAMADDPFFTEEDGDLAAAQALVAATDRAELFLYPGKEHLFSDSTLAAYDAEATALLKSRIHEFLAAVS